VRHGRPFVLDLIPVHRKISLGHGSAHIRDVNLKKQRRQPTLGSGLAVFDWQHRNGETGRNPARIARPARFSTALADNASKAATDVDLALSSYIASIARAVPQRVAECAVGRAAFCG
jgi:hypothetical protein